MATLDGQAFRLNDGIKLEREQTEKIGETARGHIKLSNRNKQGNVLWSASK